MADEDEVEGGAGACVLGFLDVAHCRYGGVEGSGCCGWWDGRWWEVSERIKGGEVGWVYMWIGRGGWVEEGRIGGKGAGRWKDKGRLFGRRDNGTMGQCLSTG